MSSSEREMLRLLAKVSGVGFAFLLIWAGMTFALGQVVSMGLAAGLPLGAAVLLFGIWLVARWGRRSIERLERLDAKNREQPHGLPVQLPGAAAAPPRDLP